VTVEALPTQLGSLASIVSSSFGLGSWFKLMIFGGLVETCRRLGMRIWDRVVGMFWISFSFNEEDDSYGSFFSFALFLPPINIQIWYRMDDILAL
jgi:hypothetical protein